MQVAVYLNGVKRYSRLFMKLLLGDVEAGAVVEDYVGGDVYEINIS